MSKRIMQGVVVSDKMEKTVTVLVTRRLRHPVYGKFIRRQKRYHAHDPHNSYRQGDHVRIRECAPISRSKCWEVVSPPQASAVEASG